MTLLVVVLGVGVYAGTLPLYLFFKVSRPALALGQATEAIAAVGADVARRDSALDEAVAELHALDARHTVSSASVASARRLLELGRTPARYDRVAGDRDPARARPRVGGTAARLAPPARARDRAGPRGRRRPHHPRARARHGRDRTARAALQRHDPGAGGPRRRAGPL